MKVHDRTVIEKRRQENPTIQHDTNHEYFEDYEWRDKITYKGIHLFKYPADLITYQQIIYDTVPDVIIETGTCRGASALFFLDTMISCGIPDPMVITMDINPGIYQIDSTIPGIERIIKSSLDPSTINQVSDLVKERSVMVSLDSDHVANHVYAELKIYSNFVTPGNYLVIEDTFLGEYAPFNGRDEQRFQENTGKTPKHAVDDFLKTTDKFIIDKSRNKYISMNPNGFLIRIKEKE